jgi:hypothetical protein
MRILLALSLVLVLAGPVDAIFVEGSIATAISADFVPTWISVGRSSLCGVLIQSLAIRSQASHVCVLRHSAG